MKKSKKGAILIALLLLAIIFVVCGILYTNAKYISSTNGNVSASVAKWVFNVTGNDSYATTDTIENLTIAQTCNASTLTNGKIAPGTSGSFDIVVNAETTEVGLDYNVVFTESNGNTTLPTNLKFKLDGSDWNFTDGISGKISSNADSKVVTHTVTWSWDYETTSGDLADTTDGINSLDYLFNVTATGIQVAPTSN